MTNQLNFDNYVGIQEVDYAEHKSVQIHDAEYVYIEAGKGPLILMLHGYPDNAYSWEHQIKFFVGKGYRVVAPFLRGYAPTKTPEGAYFDRATLAKDVAGLVDALNDGKPTYLVGQDWGAAVSYGALGAFPEKFSRAMVLAVPHPAEIMRTLKHSPRHCVRSFHWFLFQIPVLPELLIRWTRGGFLTFLWRIWSDNFTEHKHVEHINRTILMGQGVEDTLAYYRAAVQERYRDPQNAAIWKRLNDKIVVPTKVLCGNHDMRKEMLPRMADLFDTKADYQWTLIDTAGHFLHREQVDLVNTEILHWLRAD